MTKKELADALRQAPRTTITLDDKTTAIIGSIAVVIGEVADEAADALDPPADKPPRTPDWRERIRTRPAPLARDRTE